MSAILRTLLVGFGLTQMGNALQGTLLSLRGEMECRGRRTSASSGSAVRFIPTYSAVIAL
ncbi:MAG TPA: hypothetical protein VGJ20_10500 [Xanthobacteraceae bacterium]|jgi:hypothetical protein